MVAWRATERRVLAITFVATFVLALALKTPAATLLSPGLLGNISGTIWHGTATIGASPLPGDAAHRLDWDFAPVASLARGRLAFSVGVVGVGTALTGVAEAWPGAPLVDRLDGRADWSLVSALAPALPIRCATALTVHALRLGRGQVAGEIVSDPGRCGPAGVNLTTPVPRLVATGAGSTLVVSPWAARGDHLVEATLRPDARVTVHVTPRGAIVFGGTFPPGGATLETTL